MAGKNERIRLEILDHDSVAHIGSAADFHFASDVDWLNLLKDSDSDSSGNFDPDGEMDAFFAEEDLYGSLDYSSSPDESEEQGFSHTFESAQKTKKGVMPREILDFGEHALQWSALAIYEAIQVLYRTIDSPEESTHVVNWLFGTSRKESTDQISFEQCCYAHNARPDVLRMRLMFELWRLGKYATQPFALADFELPDYMFTSIFLEHGMHAQQLANTLWTFPGATLAQLKNIVTYKELETLLILSERYYASPSYGETDPNKQRWYLTGINPILKSEDVIRPTLNRQRRIELSWSRHFPE